MSSRESRAAVRGSAHKRSQSKEKDPPLMSDATPLRIVLLGKSVSENSRVGNFILGRSVFDSEAPPDVVERVGGRLKHRRVILINCPQLLHTNISDHQITQTARECVSLSDPGPHVVLLLLQHEQCSAEDQERVEKLLDSFSERLLQHSMVLSTQEPTETNEILQKIIHKCSNRHFSLQRSSSPDDLLQALEDIEQSNEGQLLLCAQYEAFTEEKQRYGERLNVVVCGSDGSLKSSISELIQQQTHRRSESVRTDVDLLLNVLELPALFNTGLSEEEVMRQTLRCVSLCHPGVHAFLLIIPDAPLNNQDRAEMEEIKRIFSSRINKHLMILIKQNSERQTAELNEETQAVIESFGGRHHFCGPKTQVSTLMENIEQMLEENRGGFFSTETFLEAQMKKLMKYEEMKKINTLERSLLTKVPRVNTDDEVRIVLLGKTGVGKSTTGNTILRRAAFTAETSHQPVTKLSQRETSEISGRQVTVIDTPGLFDTELTNEEIQTEIRHCISMILPGPHVFLLLIPLGRFTKEEETAVKIIQETFGENSLKFTMVLFTRGDDLGNKTIEEYLGKPGSPLMNLIEACGNRFHVFNNNQTEDRTQVSDLLEKIDNMVKANGGSFYSCKMFREMERERQEQQMKILMDRVREAEEEMKKLMMMMEEERQNHDLEKKRREDELKRKIREEEKHQREIRDQMKRERETFRHEIEEMRKEKEKITTEKDNLRTEYQTETDRLMNRIEKERKKREEEYREKEEQYKTLIKEKEEKEKEMKEEMRKEKEKLQIRYDSETDRLMNRIEKERLNHEIERKRREEEFRQREERYKRLMKEREEKMQAEMKREREEWEKLKEEEKRKEEEEQEELRIVLIGRTGSGKSATGNTILGRKEFLSKSSMYSVTTASEKGVGEVDGRSVAVVDTPGLFDTTLSNDQVVEEIVKCVSLSAPGPHVFVIVLSLGRVTKEEADTVDLIKKIFGHKAAQFSIVLFTRGDDLEDQSIEDYVKRSKSAELQKLIRDCGNRFLAFNNRDKQDRTQVIQLLKMIEEVKTNNQGRYFTNSMFEEAEMSIKKRMEEIMKERNRDSEGKRRVTSQI